jgi:hypothetical protein
MSFSKEVAKKQRSRGLPGEPLYGARLLFNDAAATMVLACSLRRGGIRLPQAYFRSVTQDRYIATAEIAKRTFGWSGEIGIDYPFVCQEPRFICLASQYDLSWAETGAPIKSLGILRVDLVKKSCELWDIGDGTTVNLILQRVLGCNASGEEIFATVGFPEPGLHGYQIAYAVTRLSWSARRVDRIHTIDDVFF